MPSRPRRPVRRPPRHPAAPRTEGAAFEWAPLAGPPRDGAAAATPPPLALSVRTAAEAAHGALRDALHDLGRPVDVTADVAADVAAALTPEVEPDRWADEGGPLGRLYAGDHCLSDAEREAWEARAFASDCASERVYAAAGAYARALRREGVGLPAALVAVRATVAADAGWLPAAVHTAMQRGAAQCCLEAFYPH